MNETVITSLLTSLIILTLGYSYHLVYWLGFRRGVKAGEDAATIRLFRFKNPDVWEVAHALDHELQSERKTDKHPVIRPSNDKDEHLPLVKK